MRTIPPFVWTLIAGAVLFVSGTAIFLWASGAPDDRMERLPWVGRLIVYIIGLPMGWLLLAGPVAFLAVLQLLRWLESRPQR